MVTLREESDTQPIGLALVLPPTVSEPVVGELMAIAADGTATIETPRQNPTARNGLEWVRREVPRRDWQKLR